MAVNNTDSSGETDTFLREGHVRFKDTPDEQDSIAPLYLSRTKQRDTIRKKLLQSKMKKKSQDKEEDGNNNTSKRPDNPYTSANFLSKLTFW